MQVQWKRVVEKERGRDAGNLLKIERRQIEGKCGRAIATEPRASDGPAGVVIPILSLCGAPGSSLRGTRGSLLLEIEVGSRLGETAFPSLTETQDGQ